LAQPITGFWRQGSKHSIRHLGRGADLPQLFHELSRPEVIVVDVSVIRGLDTIAALRSHQVEIPLIALGVGPDTADIIVCAEAGAAGYVLADASVDELIKAIDDVLSGRLACPPTIAFDLFRMVGTSRPSQRLDTADFTPREQEVLRLLGNGWSNKEIARSLGIAVSTVKNHVHHILEKSDVCSRRHAAQKSPFMLAPAGGHGPAEDLVPTLFRLRNTAS
jgi:DNA-binding NarL/FixJ family response regulator